jgi:hypothetical protein
LLAEQLVFRGELVGRSELIRDSAEEQAGVGTGRVSGFAFEEADDAREGVAKQMSGGPAHALASPSGGSLSMTKAGGAGRFPCDIAADEAIGQDGISDRKLFEIHARYLALYNSPDPREKALGLKALDMAYRLTGAYGVDSTERQQDLIGQMNDDELVAFVERREVPERLAEYFPGGRLLLPHDT